MTPTLDPRPSSLSEKTCLYTSCVTSEGIGICVWKNQDVHSIVSDISALSWGGRFINELLSSVLQMEAFPGQISVAKTGTINEEISVRET